jgi:uncharacterized membrane protein
MNILRKIDDDILYFLRFHLGSFFGNAFYAICVQALVALIIGICIGFIVPLEVVYRIMFLVFIPSIPIQIVTVLFHVYKNRRNNESI